MGYRFAGSGERSRLAGRSGRRNRRRRCGRGSGRLFRQRRDPTALPCAHHLAGNLAVLAIGAASLLLRGWVGEAEAVLPWGLLMSAGVVALLGYTGWHGGEMVFGHGVGMRPHTRSAARGPSAEVRIGPRRARRRGRRIARSAWRSRDGAGRDGAATRGRRDGFHARSRARHGRSGQLGEPHPQRARRRRRHHAARHDHGPRHAGCSDAGHGRRAST
ncbi:DUF2231 domain-containing protein [Mesorhizobium sp.]|uniref:DUF2231 domain-containing protein n=1 Tax=Mesorhizobium sp. TaxID=1871066 RepID=UPI00342047F0